MSLYFLTGKVSTDTTNEALCGRGLHLAASLDILPDKYLGISSDNNYLPVLNFHIITNTNLIYFCISDKLCSNSCCYYV